MKSQNMPRVGDRVNITGQDAVFFVLDMNGEARSVSLLPSDNGRILSDISVDTLTVLPKSGE